MRKATIFFLLLVCSTPTLADCPDNILHDMRNDGYYSWYGQCFRGLRCQRCNEDKHNRSRIKVISEIATEGNCTREDVRAARNNGCSGGAPHDRGRFHAACVEHDTCYGIGGNSKKYCDDMFLTNMLDICTHSGPGCRVSAQAFHKTVALAPEAQNGYDKGQKWYDLNCRYEKTRNAGIPGFNEKTYQGISIEDCLARCTSNSWCKSADYERAAKKCFLQPVTKMQHSLRRDYPGNPYDHYHRLH